MFFGTDPELAAAHVDVRLCRGFSVLFYRAVLPLSSRTLNFTAAVVRRAPEGHRLAGGKPNPGQESLLVLVYLRKGERFDELAAGIGVGWTTALRYVNEVAEPPAGRAPKHRQAVLLRQAQKARHEPAGHRLAGRQRPVGLRGHARVRP